MNQELERLIELAIADGQITEKERSVILKKATEFGIDVDEAEMILDGKLHQIQANNVKSNREKVGNIKTCPSCGSPVQSFVTKCAECDHEFSNIEVAFTVQKLVSEFSQIETESRKEYFSKGMDKHIIHAIGIVKKDTVYNKSAQQIENEIEAVIVEKKLRLLSTFPVPNTREDMLEILSIGVPEAKIKIGFSDRIYSSKGKMKKGWLAKCEQIIIKARFSMKDDKKTLEEIEFYAKQLGIK